MSRFVVISTITCRKITVKIRLQFFFVTLNFGIYILTRVWSNFSNIKDKKKTKRKSQLIFTQSLLLPMCVRINIAKNILYFLCDSLYPLCFRFSAFTFVACLEKIKYIWMSVCYWVCVCVSAYEPITNNRKSMNKKTSLEEKDIVLPKNNIAFDVIQWKSVYCT